MLVENVFDREPVLVKSHATLREAWEELERKNKSCCIVVNRDGKFKGIVERAVVYNLLAAVSEGTVGKAPCSTAAVSPATPLREAVLLEGECIAVTENGTPVGVLLKSHALSVMLRDTEIKLKALLESTHNGIMAIDSNGNVSIINKAAAKILGVDAKEAIGRHISQVLASQGLLDVLETRAPQTGQRVEIAGRIFITNRTPIWHDGKVIGAIAVFQDISELESVSKELDSYKIINQELDAIIESSYDGIYVTDGKGVTERVNTAYERITGYRRSEVIGKYMGDLVAAGYFDQSVSLLVQKEKKPVTIMQELKKTGKHVIVTGNPVFNKNGEMVKIVTNVRDITELNQLRQQLEETRELSERYLTELEELRKQTMMPENFVANSPEMLRLLELVKRVAQVDTTVLLQGESGVGKEVIAKIIHQYSARNKGPFIKINCAAIPEGLLESELFGYEGGAFTGARKQGKPGLIEMAAGGTLLLDEIGEMPFKLQAKVLRVIQEREIVRVGGTRTIEVDTRIIAATNKNLEQMVKDKEFREDLFYRLNVVTIVLPPLRKRRADIKPLVFHFLQRYNKKYKKNIKLDPDVLEVFYRYHWPGNIRELENTVEQLVVMATGELVTTAALPESMRTVNTGRSVLGDTLSLPLPEAVEALEARLIEEALRAEGTLSAAAQRLGIHRTTVMRKAKKYGIAIPSEQ